MLIIDILHVSINEQTSVLDMEQKKEGNMARLHMHINFVLQSTPLRYHSYVGILHLSDMLKV